MTLTDSHRRYTPGRHRRRGRRRKEMPLWQELPILLVVAFFLAVIIRTFVTQAFEIPSGSMENTLAVGDHVVVNKMVPGLRNPVRGEIVVFRGPPSWHPAAGDPIIQTFLTKFGRTIGDLVGVERPGERDFIKRVIGLPGDRVACCDPGGLVTVNGNAVPESYIYENSTLDAPASPRACVSRRFDEVIVAPGNMWVMGDHRAASSDARCSGQVPMDHIIGQAFLIVWPLHRIGRLPVPDVWRRFAVAESAVPDSAAPPMHPAPAAGPSSPTKRRRRPARRTGGKPRSTRS